MTNKTITYNALNSHYLDTFDMSINTKYLNDAIILWGMNTYKFYSEITNKRRKVSALVWSIFMDLINDHIKNNEYPYNQDMVCSSAQLKSWLNEYGQGCDTLKQAVEHFENERRELLDGEIK